ncbi:DUF3732 domain-containing protein [Chryseobacterium sp. RP-3-3]|uniref:DUF3732 domain-containing protein n=1 Tax=Chryseobacterium antibioticum TaxID=2728847 RepID=A0A7Y0ASB5_9FLAO|nr:DUF3732 domain-containing protein [Chryseobacterium antibioticum]NML72452.1 DUF3732 domain-containing protein [Chryseobacterium antibioticum]
MKFILHEIKLWFKDKSTSPKSYILLPNKVNIITGDSTTGKTSFWNIIDYCLLSGKVTIPTEIIEKVEWFGIRFTINNKDISLIRKTPEKGAVSSSIYFNFGKFPDRPIHNKEIAETKAILDEEFGIDDNLRFPYGKELGRTSFNVSYRHFLIFNSLTQTIIDAPETYFDTTFYGKEEYDKALNHIFDLVIGVNDMKNIKADERLKAIENKLRKIQSQIKGNQKIEENFQAEISKLISWCKRINFIEHNENFEDIDSAISILLEIVKNTKQTAKNASLFSEIDSLTKKKKELQSQVNAITQYQREYELYKRNLNKAADSLQPIEYLNKKLSDQLVESYETRVFVEYLETSLKDIKQNLSNKKSEPLKVTGDITALGNEIDIIDKKLVEISRIKANYLKEGEKFIELGKIDYALEQTLKNRIIKPIDTIGLNELNDEKERLMKGGQENSQIKFTMDTLLNESIQRNFDQLSSLQTYNKSKVNFNSEKMLLQLTPTGQLFALDNVGSASNYMFMHLSLYLGLHEHIINLEQEHVPPFLFIDQPSTPYYEGKNNDREKLIDAFTLLNSFMEYIVVEKKKDFQIFMVEHAPKDYWENNDFVHFHTVDEFINGNGLIPKEIYNN